MVSNRPLALLAFWLMRVLALLPGTTGMGVATAMEVGLHEDADATTTAGGGDAPGGVSSGATTSAAARWELLSAARDADPPSTSEGVAETAAAQRAGSRELVSYTLDGDTSTAANSTGNPNQACSLGPGCINGCPSLFYKVTGGNGGKVTASSTGTRENAPGFYVWEGNNDDCATFTCTPSNRFGSASEDSIFVGIDWTAKTGAEYYVQMFGDPGGGTFVLTVSSVVPIVVSEANVCQPPPPTHAPTDAPTNAPSEAPTDPPSEAPTDAPTALPTDAPSMAPTVPCAGGGTTYWLYDPTTNAPIRKLINNTATCLLHPYNLEVRRCNATEAAAVSRAIHVQLLDARGGSPAVVYKSKPHKSPPYFLFGPAPTNGDVVLPSPEPLRNGAYYLEAKGVPEWGKLKFTQSCPRRNGAN